MKKTLTSVLVGLVFASTSQLALAGDLLQTYQQALQNDPKVLKAQANYNAAQEDIIQARAVLYPRIGFGFDYTKSTRDGTGFDPETGPFNYESKTTNYGPGVNLNMEIYHHDSWLGMDNAKKRAHQSDISYQASQQELIVRVTEAYFNVLKANDDLEFSLAEKKAISRQLEQTQERYNVGLTAITDVHEAQAKFDNAVADEIRAQNGVYNAEEALREITNAYPKDLKSLNTELFSVSMPSPESADQWQQMAEAKNLNLINQKISVDIAKENINIAQAGHYPTLDLRGSKGYGKGEQNGIDSPRADSQSITLSFSVPIYSGGATESKVRQAQHNYVAASQDLESTYRNVVKTTRNSYNTLVASISSIKALEQSVISAESALKATEAGFEVGTRTIVDVLDSTRNLYNAKRNLSSTRYSYITNILNLKSAAGTISEQDLNAINSALK